MPTTDPLMAATDVQTIEQHMAVPLFPARTVEGCQVYRVLAVAMTVIGPFVVTAYLVSQRTREIGVSIALGARRTDVMKMVMTQGLRLTAMGLRTGGPRLR